MIFKKLKSYWIILDILIEKLLDMLQRFVMGIPTIKRSHFETKSALSVLTVKALLCYVEKLLKIY